MSDQLYIAYFKEKEDIGNCKAKAIYNLRMHQSKNLIKLVTKDQNRQGQELVNVDVFVCFFCCLMSCSRLFRTSGDATTAEEVLCHLGNLFNAGGL